MLMAEIRYLSMELAMRLEPVAERVGDLEEATGRFEEWLREQVRPRDEG